MGIGTEKILKEMCRRVGADYSTIDFSAPEWYLKHTWTLQQEKEFTQWLSQQIKKDPDIRKTFTTTPASYLSKNTIESMARGWVFNYGWYAVEQKNN